MSSVAIGIPGANPEAFTALYREFHPRVLRLCHYLLGSREEAEDAASEVFVRLPRAIQTYDRAQPFWRWLSTVVRHYCVDLLRCRRSEQRLFEPANPRATEPAAPTTSPLDRLVFEEEKQAVRTALARLPERYRAPLVLRYYNDLSYDQIAETLELSRSNAAILIFRAKQQLRGALAAEAAT